PLTYLWDVNGDGTFGDAVGAEPTLSWTKLRSVGIKDGPRTFAPRVRVSAGAASATSSAATLNVVDRAPSLSFAANATVPQRDVFLLPLVHSDPGADALRHWTISWGDGSSDTWPGLRTSARHVYAKTGTFTIRATADDEDGRYAAIPAKVTVQ